MSLDLVTMLDASGAQIIFAVQTLVGGGKVAAHLFVDQTGAPIGVPTNPFLTAPAIYPVVPVDHSGAAGTAVDIAANAARKGGSIVAGANNSGLVTVVLKVGGVVVHTRYLAQGVEFSLTVNGYVLQVEVTISAATAGDAWQAVEYI